MKIRTITSLLLLFLFVSVNAQQRNTSERYPILMNMVHHNPGEPHFESEYTQPEYIKSLGYVAQVPKIEIQCGLTYDDWENNIVPEKTAEKLWIQRHAANVRTRIDIAEKHGVPVYPFTDVFVVPKSIMDKYGEEMKVDGRLSIKSPKTQEILRAQIEEIFKRFPKIDGLTIRHGETYLHDTPFHVGTSPARTPEEHTILINLLRDEICIKRNKKLFYRTWDFGKFHTNPDFYLEATNAVETHPDLHFSIKHVNNDFLRGNPFNTTIGIGKHQQIVEISTNQAGVYGRNSHPYYIGKGVIEGWSEMGDTPKGIQDLYNVEQVKGFWTWTWGDGWVGPYFNNELWINLNEYVIRSYVQNPKKNEVDIFHEYATQHLKLSKEDAEKLRELCLLSTDASYYGQASKYVKTNPWWIRDHYLTGLDLSEVVKQNLQKKVFAEKKENLKLWYKIEELSKEIRLPNSEQQEFLQVSSTYGRIKYEIVEQLWMIQILLAEHKLNGSFDAKMAKTALASYTSKWKEWEDLRKTYPSCPTLYVDHEAVHIDPPFQQSIERINELLKR